MDEDQRATITSVSRAYLLAFHATKLQIVTTNDHATNQELVKIMSDIIKSAKERGTYDDFVDEMQSEREKAASRVNLPEGHQSGRNL